MKIIITQKKIPQKYIKCQQKQRVKRHFFSDKKETKIKEIKCL